TSIRRHGCGGKRCHLDPVADRRVPCPAEPLHAFHDNLAIDLNTHERAHLLKKMDEIHDLRLHSSVANHRGTSRPYRSQEQVLRRADTGKGQFDVCCLKTAGLDAHGTGSLHHLDTHLSQTCEVKVHCSLADPAATRPVDR